MLYKIYEMKNAAMWPARFWAETTDSFIKAFEDHSFFNMPYGKLLTASNAVVERTTRLFDKPSWNIDYITRQGKTYDVCNQVITRRPFCTLRRFAKYSGGREQQFDDPPVLVVAPLSGHYATLVRDTVDKMLEDHDVYVTDWHDARHVEFSEGDFSLDDYIDYLLDFTRLLGRELHIIAICQPSVPVMAATSLLATYKEECQPNTITLMGGPIDTQINPGLVNKFVKSRSIKWFEKHFISTVPRYYPGGGRRVCPGFIMLNGFMSMNIERHHEATLQHFNHLVEGDQDNAEKHRKFYDEYRAVMDLPATYFLESLVSAFYEHQLPNGKLKWRGYKVKPEDIINTAVLTVEGEKDDISCPGQTKAALDLCPKLPKSMKKSYVQKGVGHYGIFNGRRWRECIQPVIAKFIQKHRNNRLKIK